MKRNLKKGNKEKKNSFKTMINSIKEYIQVFKKNPKKELHKILKNFKKIFKENSVFCLYVICTTINASFLRWVTIHNFSLKPFLADLTFVILLGSFSFIIRPKRRTPYLLFIHIFLTLVCFIHSIYFTFYSSFASVSLLSTSRFLGDVGDAVTDNVFQLKDMIYWIPTAYFIGCLIRYRKTRIGQEPANKKKFTASLISAFICLIIFCLSVTGVEWSRFAKQWNRVYIVHSFGLYTYQANDIVQSIKPKINSLFGYDKAFKEFKEYFAKRNEELKGKPKNEYTGIYEGKNIISIHAESMMNFLVDLKFNGQEVTPNLNKLAHSGLYFNNFQAQVSVGTSSDSEFTLNTSLMPSNSGTVFVSYFNRTYETIPKQLKEKGYYTFSMHANNKTFWNRNTMYETLGYDRFYNKEDYEVKDENIIGLGLSDEEFFKQSIPYLKELEDAKKPFYGTVIMLSNHTPFSEVDKYGEFDLAIHEKNEKGEDVTYPYLEGTKLGNYLKSAHYADKALGQFLDDLEKEGILDNTIIVLYGDHDNRLSKKEYIRMRNYDKENDDIYDKEDERYQAFDEYDYEINRSVPFIIYDKTDPKKTTIDYTMGMYDVMPTLGNMFGFSNKYALGHDIFDIKYDNVVAFPTGNWITNKIYYNNQKGEYKALTDEAIDANYIKDRNDYVSQLLEISNNTIVFDLIKHDQSDATTYSSEVKE